MARILFLSKSCDIGGVEIVTVELANKFVIEGHNVVIWDFYNGLTTLRDRLNAEVPIVYGNGFKVSKENVNSLRSTLIKYNINIIINQWGLPYIPAKTIRKAICGLKVKVVTVYHNDPLANERIKNVEYAIEKCHSPFLKFFFNIKRWIFYQITSASMRYSYNNCDRYMLLSESFINRFKQFTRLSNIDKLIIQTNPITINRNGFDLNTTKKIKEIIYVGRLNHNQKRVFRLVDVWSVLEKKYPDWHLTIVGDGPEKDNLFRQIQSLGLKNIRFEGFKNPRFYYERASILLLVSEFEGFGLVIVEGMCFGVVPVVLGSYPAIYDIIDNGINGIIVPYDKKGGFDKCLMAKELEKMIYMYGGELNKISESAYSKSFKFDMNNIYDSWNKIIKDLCL